MSEGLIFTRIPCIPVGVELNNLLQVGNHLCFMVYRGWVDDETQMVVRTTECIEAYIRKIDGGYIYLMTYCEAFQDPSWCRSTKTYGGDWGARYL